MTRICCYLILSLSIFSSNEGSETGKEELERINTESQEVKIIIANKNKQIVEWYKNKRGDSLVNQMADNVIVRFDQIMERLKGGRINYSA